MKTSKMTIIISLFFTIMPPAAIAHSGHPTFATQSNWVHLVLEHQSLSVVAAVVALFAVGMLTKKARQMSMMK